jgi:hypothetical protein
MSRKHRRTQHYDRVAVVTDPNGVQWNIHRRWWPFPDLADILDLDWFILSLIVAIPFVSLWPFWYAAKFLGVKWRIVIERSHAEHRTELVRGWRRSGARVNELALEIAQGRRSGHYLV